MPRGKKKLAVVGADTLVFQSAAVSEERLVEVTHVPSSRKKIYKNRSEFKTEMKNKSFKIKQEEVLHT